MIKTPRKNRNKGEFPQSDEEHLPKKKKKKTAKIILNGERLIAFPYKIQNKVTKFALIQYSAGYSSQCSRQEKINKKYTDQKGRNETVYIFR